ncbi:LysR family transcriptional regulator [Ketobacter alkanivorans]|uniref:HTH lysR-type domain-containing protein n=1 Tax=Ketobacter alkanivorans TaxID=1917421 RepID=A0A2K9LL26_9GAMM|nr:LysR family transcriptional regulator [Ketobacter alkanivorans]AUM12937.1 hypothetical protein Kalk_11105 [Ketobacter alkanivorans]
MNKVEWSDLYFFNAVARNGSLAKAAQALGVTHSTVFRRINSLEEDLGVKLFDRLPDGYRLTALGEELETYSEQVSSTIDDMQRMLFNRNDQMKGPINLTAPHNFAYHFLPPLIQKFQAQYPGVTVNLMVSNADYNLSRREADLAIRATSAPPEFLIGSKLFSLRWAAYACQEYIAKTDTPIRDLNGHDVILANQSLQNLAVFKWADSQVNETQIVARCNDLMSMSALAATGLGIALLPDDQFKQDLVRLFELDSRFTSDIWVLMHPDLRGCTRLIEFKNFLLQQLREDPVFQKFGLQAS